MTDIMEEDCDLRGDKFPVADLDAFASKSFENTTHEVHCTQSVLKPGMIGSGVNKVSQSQLTDVAKSLKYGMLYQIEKKIVVDRDESVNGIVNDLVFLSGTQLLTVNF